MAWGRPLEPPRLGCPSMGIRSDWQMDIRMETTRFPGESNAMAARVPRGKQTPRTTMWNGEFVLHFLLLGAHQMSTQPEFIIWSHEAVCIILLKIENSRGSPPINPGSQYICNTESNRVPCQLQCLGQPALLNEVFRIPDLPEADSTSATASDLGRILKTCNHDKFSVRNPFL